MKRTSATVGILLLATAIGAGCAKRDKHKPVDTSEAEKPVPVPAPEKPPEPPEPAMPEHTVSVFITHEIEDWDRWKQVFDGYTDARKQSGAIWHSVSRDAKNENKIYIHIVGTGMAKATAFLESDDRKKAMKESGVKGKPEIWVANDVELKSPEGNVHGETSSIFGRHEVEDFDRWKAVFDADEARRSAMGVLGGSLSRDADNENMVIFHFMVADPAVVADAMASEAMHKKMQAAGVKGKPAYAWGKDVEVSMYR